MSNNRASVSKDIHEKRWAIVSLASIPLIMTLGNSMLIPVLPLMEKKLDITALQSSYIITFYSVVAIILIPLAGFLSDRYGRKIVIIPSLLIAGAGGLLSGYAAWKMESPYMIILIGRILQGVGVSGTAPIVLPLVGDMFKREKDVSATLGLIETSNTLGKVLSPILGAFLAGIVWFLPFWSIPVFCLISAVSVLFLVKKPKKVEDPFSFRKYWKDTKHTFKEHGAWLLAVFIIGAILMFVLFGILFYLSSVLEDEYQITGIKKGFYLAAPLAALCSASYITGKKIGSDIKRMKLLTIIGLVTLVTAVLIIALSSYFLYVLFVFLIGGIGIGIGLPCLDAIITETIDKEVRGTTTCLYSSARYVGVALGPPVTAFLMKYTIWWMVVVFSFSIGIALFFAFKKIHSPVS
ncbi:bacillibactin exporter [Paraliobacillus ryukyuensis]|uniref:ACDE family multidrug resistance protein n=1 Tax=Paraliobacillus ryukyuensis TaxID=200904 RepID=A0A366E7B6_9BACI|nr:MFS transporter [Paraliobacillus ryukyuensis]RBO98280.1 ACDE family multidrug resistance protein [Paraliobacillus ryukyuensis]